MLTRAGAKLMDFGLARAPVCPRAGRIAVRSAQSPTVVAPLTAEGSIIGTFQYMSPEQLEGRETDARGDLWALGCRAVRDGDRQARVRRPQPGVADRRDHESRAGADRAGRADGRRPRSTGWCVICWRRIPEERIQSAHDVKLQLASMAESGSSWSAPGGARARRPAPPRARAVVAFPWVIAGRAVGRSLIGSLDRANDRRRRRAP
jgi:serine/threonine protein kinase